MIDFY